MRRKLDGSDPRWVEVEVVLGGTMARWALVLMVSVLSLGQHTPDIVVEFHYGVDGRNVLDTRAGTYTKDMVYGDSLVADFKLTPRELNDILSKAESIGFFDLPKLIVTTDMGCIGYPHSEYTLEISDGARSHRVEWSSKYCAKDDTRERAEELAIFIMRVIHKKPEYRNLPRARGAYL